MPKCLVRLKGEAVDEYRKRWGYQRVEVLDKVQKRMVEDWEDVDVFLQVPTCHSTLPHCNVWGQMWHLL